MSVARCIILGMTNELVSSKYTFACDPDECDCLIEVTSSDGFGFPSGVMEITCPCGRKPNLLSVEHATIQPTNERNTMEGLTETNLPLSDAERYNPNMLVTYKQIENGETSYQTEKVVYIEMALDGARRSNQRADGLTSTIEEIKSFMTEDNWYNPNTEASEILTELERILDFNPTRTIEFSGMISFSGSIEVPLNESEDFDLFYHLQDNLTLDAFDGNIEIDSYEVDRVDGN